MKHQCGAGAMIPGESSAIPKLQSGGSIGPITRIVAANGEQKAHTCDNAWFRQQWGDPM
jgi:hypothetical protein